MEITSVESLANPEEILEKPVDSGWFVAVVRCNCERKIAASIELDFSKNKTWLELWVPMQKIVYIEKRSNKRRTKEKPFLPTYIFCRVSKKHLNDIRFRSDVYKMLTMPGQREIYQVPDKELDDYRRLVENPDIPAVAYMGPFEEGTEGENHRRKTERTGSIRAAYFRKEGSHRQRKFDMSVVLRLKLIEHTWNSSPMNNFIKC